MTDSRDDGKAALVKARDDLAREHAALGALLATVRERSAAPPDAAHLLSELHKALAKHFAHETYAGGFYDAVRGADPRLEPEIDALGEEHTRLLATTQALRERAERGEVDVGPFAAEIDALAGALGAHERRERALVDRALGG
jgi:hypothetical protein